MVENSKSEGGISFQILIEAKPDQSMIFEKFRSRAASASRLRQRNRLQHQELQILFCYKESLTKLVSMYVQRTSHNL
jgi:hypothetical protein